MLQTLCRVIGASKYYLRNHWQNCNPRTKISAIILTTLQQNIYYHLLYAWSLSKI